MPRRALPLLATCLVLAACNDGLTPGGPEPVPATVVLEGTGFRVAGTEVPFSTDRADVEEMLAVVLGEARAREENRECGAGPMQFTRYPEGLTANFQQDRLVGWYLDTANPKIALANGITVGTGRERIAGSPEFMLIPESTLGEEFALGEAVGGFIEDGKVDSLYAGVNCFFR